MNIAVVGLGHIGLPLAAQYASKGHIVFGADINRDVVLMINEGRAYGDEPGLEEMVSLAVREGRLSAQTTTSRAVSQADVVVIIVPLVVDDEKNIDYGSIDAATRDVADGLKPGTLVVYETTLPVGDTRRRFAPALEAISGLDAGRDFSVAFSPERVYVGRVFSDLKRYPKIVGGIDRESTVRARAFYEAVLDAEILAVDNAETAEFTKLAETTYRDVNIALANEFAQFADEAGIDVMQGINAANTQPFSHIHKPGAGVGGHCIPVYPYFYANRTPYSRIAHLAREVNDQMADYVIGRLERALVGISGKTIAVFGWAYRENVKEDAFTVARNLVKAIEDRGGCAVVNDPLYSNRELIARGLAPYEIGDDITLDAVVIQAAHAQYEDTDWTRVKGMRVILDARNALDRSRLPDDVMYAGIGVQVLPDDAAVAGPVDNMRIS
jgi:nucleotide sugar dehydrogenase